MSGAPMFVEEPAAARLRAWCWTLLLAPFAVFIAAEVGSRLLAVAPSDNVGVLRADAAVDAAWRFLFAAVHAEGIHGFLLETPARQYLTEDFLGPPARLRSIGRQGPWLIGRVAVRAARHAPGRERDAGGLDQSAGRRTCCSRPGASRPRTIRPDRAMRLRVPRQRAESHQPQCGACVRDARALGGNCGWATHFRSWRSSAPLGFAGHAGVGCWRRKAASA